MHLLLPLLASVLLVCGLIFIKRAGELAGDEIEIGPVTPLFLTNIISAVVFSFLWILGGEVQPLAMFWQPAIIAMLFISGLVFTLLAISRGDVSIATPVLGVKVLLVAVMLTVILGHQLPPAVWLAAVLAMIGIGVIQWTGRSQPKRVVATIGFAILAATSFATFDVLVQRWAPAWRAGRFLPITYWIVGILSCGMIPWVNFSAIRQPRVGRLLLIGALLVAVQSTCITVAVAAFEDAARINVVYTLRGLWGVLLAWGAAKIWGGAEAHLTQRVMVTRVVGAALLTSAVVLVILSMAE
ncbi:MAG: DMT family transporter [Pirellulaceae bacterium]